MVGVSLFKSGLGGVHRPHSNREALDPSCRVIYEPRQWTSVTLRKILAWDISLSDALTAVKLVDADEEAAGTGLSAGN